MRCIFNPLLSKFWTQNPALVYALFALTGSCLALYSINGFVLFLLTLVFGALLLNVRISLHSLRIRLVLAVALGCTAFLFAKTYYILPKLDEKGFLGIAEVEFTLVKKSSTPFGATWNYKGILHSFASVNQYGQPLTEIARNLPISLTLPADSLIRRPSTANSYKVQGRLKSSGEGRYSLAVSPKKPWVSLKKTSGLAEWRASAKNSVKQHIHSAIRDSHTAAFLSGIATGEFDDRILAFEMGRFGLQHIMAISGLHFAILATIIGLLLRLFLTYRTAAAALLAMLTAYFVFLGTSPSVMRAWIAIAIGLSGIIAGKRSSGLNALGVALLTIVLWDPFSINTIGFQFSFCVTAAILMWYAPCDKLLQHLFAKRRLSEIADMGRVDQHGYCILYFLRQALALGLAVNLVALPLTLYHFHKFPLMSLVYNLFFPFLISLSLLLLVAAFLAAPVAPFMANIIHALNERYTQFTLNFAFNLPSAFDWTIRLQEIPIEVLTLYLSSLFIGGIVVKNENFYWNK